MMLSITIGLQFFALAFTGTWGYDLRKVQFQEIPFLNTQVEIESCDANPSCGGVLFMLKYPETETLTSDSPCPTPNKKGFDGILHQNSSQEFPKLLHEEENVVETSRTNTISEHRAGVIMEIHRQDKLEMIGMAKLLFIPTYYRFKQEDIYVSQKEWLIMRGSVTIPARDFKRAIIKTETHITIEEARKYCRGHPSCVAFSFPLQTKHNGGMTPLVDEVIFVSQIYGFDNGPASYVQEHETVEQFLDQDPNQVEWFTHVVHDREKLTGRVKKHINIDDAKWREYSTTPYRPCCQKSNDLPTIEQVQEMDTLPRIPCNISRHDFYEKYEKTRNPVMLVGCDKEWPAHEKWKNLPTLFRRFDNSSRWDVPHESNWAEFQDYYYHSVKQENAGFRVFSQLKPGYTAAEIFKDYSVPHPIQGADMYSMLPNYEEQNFPRGYGPMKWFLMGSYGTGTGPHVDPHATDAWNTLLHGHKWWILYPKLPRVLTLSETVCYVHCSDPNVPGEINNGEEISWYSSVGRHVHKMYYGHDAVAKQVMQNPGETIYLPYGMIHAVLNMDETIAVTQNYAAPGNFEEVWNEVLSYGSETDWKHLYYERFDEETRKRARDIVWPITEQKRSQMRPIHSLYVSIDANEVKSFRDYQIAEEANHR